MLPIGIDNDRALDLRVFEDRLETLNQGRAFSPVAGKLNETDREVKLSEGSVGTPSSTTMTFWTTFRTFSMTWHTFGPGL